MSCFPKTSIYFSRTKYLDSSLEKALRTGKGFPDKLILSEELDRESVNLPVNYTGEVVVLGHKLPDWFEAAYKGNTWRTLSLPEIKELSPDVATLLMTEGQGILRMTIFFHCQKKHLRELMGHSRTSFGKIGFASSL